jgi:hypothetical protein
MHNELLLWLDGQIDHVIFKIDSRRVGCEKGQEFETRNRSSNLACQQYQLGGQQLKTTLNRDWTMTF